MDRLFPADLEKGVRLKKSHEEEPEEPEFNRIQFMTDFTTGIEQGAKERGITVEKLLGLDQHTLWKFNMFKKELEEMKNVECGMQ